MVEGGVGRNLGEGQGDGLESGGEFAVVGQGGGEGIENGRVVGEGRNISHPLRPFEDDGGRDGRPVRGGEAPEDVVGNVGTIGVGVENAEKKGGGLVAVGIDPKEDGEGKEVLQRDGVKVCKHGGLAGKGEGLGRVSGVVGSRDAEEQEGGAGDGVIGVKGKRLAGEPKGRGKVSFEIGVMGETGVAGGDAAKVDRGGSVEKISEGGIRRITVKEAVGVKEDCRANPGIALQDGVKLGFRGIEVARGVNVMAGELGDGTRMVRKGFHDTFV